VDGQDILEMGCGWGSLTLWMAEKYPHSRITGVSNSATQREHILAQAQERGLDNVTILTCDMNEFEIAPGFDRIVSVEMFEHMKNWETLLEKAARWLRPHGKMFIHIFTHKDFAYHFEGKDETDWMSRYFFTGGQMPADAQMLHFQKDFQIEKHWRVSGSHYGKTSEAWLARMDAHKAEIWPILEQTYGRDKARQWWVYWRVFYMACAELWNYRGGEEWIVSHYRLLKR
jgi:cyclopropane-fatty-acyl-phospholipid synthase